MSNDTKKSPYIADFGHDPEKAIEALDKWVLSPEDEAHLNSLVVPVSVEERPSLLTRPRAAVVRDTVDFHKLLFTPQGKIRTNTTILNGQGMPHDGWKPMIAKAVGEITASGDDLHVDVPVDLLRLAVQKLYDSSISFKHAVDKQVSIDHGPATGRTGR